MNIEHEKSKLFSKYNVLRNSSVYNKVNEWTEEWKSKYTDKNAITEIDDEIKSTKSQLKRSRKSKIPQDLKEKLNYCKSFASQFNFSFDVGNYFKQHDNLVEKEKACRENENIETPVHIDRNLIYNWNTGIISNIVDEEMEKQMQQDQDSDLQSQPEMGNMDSDFDTGDISVENTMGNENSTFGEDDEVSFEDLFGKDDCEDGKTLENSTQNENESVGKPNNIDNLPYDVVEYNNELSAMMDEGPTEIEIIVAEWNELNDTALSDWLIHLENKRVELANSSNDPQAIAEFNDLVDKLEILDKIYIIISIFDCGSMSLWDLMADNLSNTDLDTLKNWANKLNTANVKELCELLGRCKDFDEEQAKSQSQYYSQKDRMFKSKQIPDEYVGIVHGSNISRILPAELQSLGDPDLENLFLLKFSQNQLMEFETESNAQEDVAEAINKGPVIICMDTSGSMMGNPEYAAKAIALNIILKAVSEGRLCTLINYSVNIDTREFTSKNIGTIFEFISSSFHGGTSGNKALEKALDIMETEEYADADVLILSDFEMDPIKEDVMERILEAKSNTTKFHAVHIKERDNNYSDVLKEIFDTTWSINVNKESDILKMHNIL